MFNILTPNAFNVFIDTAKCNNMDNINKVYPQFCKNTGNYRFASCFHVGRISSTNEKYIAVFSIEPYSITNEGDTTLDIKNPLCFEFRGTNLLCVIIFDKLNPSITLNSANLYTNDQTILIEVGKKVPVGCLSKKSINIRYYKTIEPAFYDGLCPNDFDCNYTGKYIVYYTSGNKRLELNIELGLEHGTCFYYFKNEKIRLEEQMLYGKRNGECTEYNENGSIKCKQIYEQDILIQKDEYKYLDDGVHMSRYKYNKYEKLTYHTTFINSIENGTRSLYNEDTTPHCNEIIVDNKITKRFVYNYDEPGFIKCIEIVDDKIKSQTTYKDYEYRPYRLHIKNTA